MRRYDSNLENAVRVVSVNEQRRLRPGSIWRQPWFTVGALDGVIVPSTGLLASSMPRLPRMGRLLLCTAATNCRLSG
jgi:hypothetical protein